MYRNFYSTNDEFDRMRREMGIFKSSFTKKSAAKPAKINKRKAARKARRNNR